MKKQVVSFVLVITFVLALMPHGSLSALAANSLVQILVEPTMEYTSVDPFFEGLAAAQIGGESGSLDEGKWGFIDKYGEIIIPFEYDAYEGFFSEGLAPVNKGGKCGYIDKTGEIVIPLIYDDARSFSEGLATVERDGKYGYINKMGEIVISFLYDIADDFSEGLANVSNYDDEDFWQGYIDTSGARIISDMVGFDFSEGMAAVVGESLNGDGFKWGFVDRSGRLVIPYQFDTPGDFSEGLAPVEKDGKFGYIDKTGKIALPFIYNYAFGYAEGLAAVTMDDGNKYIDRNGKVAFPYSYGLANSFSDGFARVIGEDEFNIIDKTGERLLPHDDLYTRMWYSEGLVVVEQDGKWGIMQVMSKPSSWAETDVSRAISLNLVPSEVQANYTQAITRAEFCALAVALYESVTGQEINGRDKFEDTTDVNVEKAAYINVVNGTGPGKFTPDTALTREQAATMLARLANAIGRPFPKISATFGDQRDISNWALEAVGQVQAAGIMKGTSADTFTPNDPYTREQSIVTILRMFDALSEA